MTNEKFAAHPESKRRALGRGLETLLPSRSFSASAESPQKDLAAESGTPLELPLDLIDRNPFQTRTAFDPVKLNELAQSIAASGVVQPVVVRRTVDGRFQLITGERRFLASKQAGKASVPAIVRVASDEQAMEMTVVENLQRADLNPMEQARAYSRLSNEFKMTQEQMATRTGKDRASVANFLRLLKLPSPIQEKVEAGELSFGHARTLLALTHPEQIASAAQKVIVLAMSVRQTENYVSRLLHPETAPSTKKPAVTVDANVHEAEIRLQQALGLKVHIEDKKGRGRVIIDYSGLDDFDAILTAFNAQIPSI